MNSKDNRVLFILTLHFHKSDRVKTYHRITSITLYLLCCIIIQYMGSFVLPYMLQCPVWCRTVLCQYCTVTDRCGLWSLRSCGCPGLERIWEADLEACHLFLRGLQLRTPSCGGADAEDLPPAQVYLPNQPPTKEEEEEDCAMLTALGGRWCPEANLQNSEFTKVTIRNSFRRPARTVPLQLFPTNFYFILYIPLV